MRFEAAILDVDGVLTRTATLHEEAWRALFQELFSRLGDERPFTRDDYLAHVDGKPRLEGLRDLLASRGHQLEQAELERLAVEKNQHFLRLLEGGRVEVFPDAVAQLRSWRRHGLALAFVSASRNAERILRAAGLDALADVRVDGETAVRDGLQGKGALFREAARRLGIERGRIAVVEDAVAGVEAAAKESFGLVVGLARTGDPGALAASGAGRVVKLLTELDDLVEPGTRPPTSLLSALRFHWLEGRLAGRRPVVLLDFDGTLAPIVAHPDQAALAPETRELVRTLAERLPVAIVSGRDLVDVRSRVGIEGIWYVGSHGFELADPHGRLSSPEEAQPALAPLQEAETRLRPELGCLQGVVIERKHFALAVHYRMADETNAEEAIARVEAAAREHPALRIHRDLMVIELQPAFEWNKGHAVESILRALGAGEESLPLYLGDGRTDEDAFRVLRERGLGILVGQQRWPTLAALRLDDQGEVVPFLRALLRWDDEAPQRHAWRLRHAGWSPETEGLREALYTLGNGRFATRGAAEEAMADGVHYPGTYLAGGYDRIATEIRGEVVVNEDLVNWPNWLRLSFRPLGGEWLSLRTFEVLEHWQELDLRRGLVRRCMRVRDRAGRETALASTRLVSMDDPWVAALAWELTPLDWSGPLELRSGLDGTVRNTGVQRYLQLANHHLVPEQLGADEETTWLVVQTRQSRIRMAQVARTRVWCGETGPTEDRVEEYADRVDRHLQIEAAAGRPIRVEKTVALLTSRDPAISEPLEDARERMRHTPDFDELAALHERRWAELWKRCDIRLGPSLREENRLLRLHLFHLLQVVSPHIVHRDVGVPARGLHGEAYRGHVFWDELFIIPFFNYRIPELTRELLMYRYLRLDEARHLARDLGLSGATFPWQSGSSGREESQRLHLNPKSGRWLPDETLRQRHISAAVAWNVWSYYETTADHEFLSYYGAELLLEIARFWAGLATWDGSMGRYRICSVMGPDEFHTRYPGSDRPGIDDNTYTNVMAAWCLRMAERALAELGQERRREVLDHLSVTDEERQKWAEVASRLRVVFHDGHILSQFDGYDALEEFDWEGYRARYGDIQRLDRILEAEGDSPNRYKSSKQADVLMLYFLFSDDELVEQLASMGYRYDPSWIPETIAYYLQRTSHGSTLSSVIHSWVLTRHDRAHSWRLFLRALQSDVADIQGGTTAEGVHLGAMAGTIDLVQRAWLGAVIRGDVLWFDPKLPDELPELCLRLHFRTAWLDVQVTHDALEVALSAGKPTCTRIGHAGRVHALEQGERRRFPLVRR